VEQLTAYSSSQSFFTIPYLMFYAILCDCDLHDAIDDAQTSVNVYVKVKFNQDDQI
jgi:hypothetical protein